MTETNLEALKQLISKVPTVGKQAIIDKINSALPKKSKTLTTQKKIATTPDKKEVEKQEQKTADILGPDSIYAQKQQTTGADIIPVKTDKIYHEGLKDNYKNIKNQESKDLRDKVLNPDIDIIPVPEGIDIDEEANKEYQAEKIRENYMNDMKKREQKEYGKHIPEKLKLIQDMADSISDEEKILLDQFLEELIESYYMQKVEEKKNSSLYV